MDPSVAHKKPFALRGKGPIAVLACVAVLAAGTSLLERLTPKLYVPGALVAAQALPTTAAAGSPTWDQLSDVQRSTLLPLKGLWPGLDQPNRQRWLEVAGHVQHLSLEAKRRAQVHMADWAKLSPQMRAEARLRYVSAKRLLQGQRRERSSKYQLKPKPNLPPGVPDARLSTVAPAMVRATLGATTILLNQLPGAAIVGPNPDNARAEPG